MAADPAIAEFFKAVHDGRIDDVRRMAAADWVMLCRGELNEHGAPDKTALHIAAYKGNKDMAAALIGLGAKLETGDLFGVTPLMLAAQRQDGGGMAALLLEAGADPFHNTKDNMTPLMFAAMTGNVEAAEIFIKRGISPNARRDCGMVALHFARHAGDSRSKMLKLLVGAGADPLLANNAHETPALLAARMGDTTYGPDIVAAVKAKEARDAAKALLDRQDRAVLEHGLPQAFAVRRQPLRLNIHK